MNTITMQLRETIKDWPIRDLKRIKGNSYRLMREPELTIEEHLQNVDNFTMIQKLLAERQAEHQRIHRPCR